LTLFLLHIDKKITKMTVLSIIIVGLSIATITNALVPALAKKTMILRMDVVKHQKTLLQIAMIQ